MYFSKEFLFDLYKKLSSLYSGTDIEAQGGTQFVSELKYFLATDYFKKQKGKACDTNLKEDKDFFVSSVGKIVLLTEDGSFLATKNFANSVGEARDFDVGSNFFSANAVAKSKISITPQKFPNRHPQLLSITKGVVDTYSGGYENLANNAEYFGKNLKKYAILFLWLNRFSNFTSKDSVYADSLFNLKKDFSSELISLLQWESSDVKYEVEKILTNVQLVNRKQYFTKDDFKSNDVNHKEIKDISFPHNRIVFGAPGTGKSNLLKIKQDEYFPNTNQQSQVSEEEIIRKELANIGNSYSKSFSLGFQYHEFFKDKKPKFIRETYGCNAEAAYITSQGARCVDFFNSLPDYSDSEITKEKVKEQLKKAEEQNYMKEAGSAAVGRKYSNYLYGKSISEICQELELVETHTQSRFIWYGVQSVDYTFEKETSEIIKLSERVTFHPNYSYAQFVGTYKPVQDSNDDEKIKYEYVPGPFMRVYVNALKHTDRNFLLLIEEINRANVAAVFGDVFQLLDRDENDNSEYPIAASEDIKKYLAKNGIHDDELKIPSNMYIWATMNSADQGVFPMDTAFKRRWEFEYIGINENEDKVKGYEIPISATKKVNWNELRKAINNKLITLGINEDKLLGPFFLSKSVLETALNKGVDFVKIFESKVLMYLFEDAAKMKAKQLFNVDEKKFIYSEVCKKFEEIGVKVFKFNDEDVVEEHDISSKEDAVPTEGKLF